MHLLWFAVLILYFKCVYSDDTADDRAKGKKSDIEPNERLFRGIIANDYDEVKRSIVLGASVNIQIGKEGHTPFIWASFYGYLNIMQLLLKHGADIEGISGDGQKTALLLASYNNKVEAVEYLLKRGANIEARNDRGDSALHLATYYGHEQMTNVLIKSVKNITSIIEAITYKHLYTPLHLAAYKGHSNIVNILLDYKADIYKRDAIQNTAFMLATMQGHVVVMRRIVEYEEVTYGKISIETKDNLENTPFMLAVNNGHIDAMHFLMGKNCEINIINKQLQTPLIRAAMKGFKDIVLELLLHGATINHKDIDTFTAIDYAKNKSHTEIVQILENWQFNLEL